MDLSGRWAWVGFNEKVILPVREAQSAALKGGGHVATVAQHGRGPVCGASLPGPGLPSMYTAPAGPPGAATERTDRPQVQAVRAQSAGNDFRCKMASYRRVLEQRSAERAVGDPC
ncbi:unnamed protein product, partial [Polarella glacialis]